MNAFPPILPFFLPFLPFIPFLAPKFHFPAKNALETDIDGFMYVVGRAKRGEDVGSLCVGGRCLGGVRGFQGPFLFFFFSLFFFFFFFLSSILEGIDRFGVCKGAKKSEVK